MASTPAATPTDSTAGAGAGSGSGSGSGAEPARTFDKAMFDSELPVVALTVPARAVSKLIPLFKAFSIHCGSHKAIVRTPDDPARRTLRVDADAVGGESLSKLPDDVREKAQALLTESGGTVSTDVLKVTYADKGYPEVLRKLLPPDVEVPSGFEMAGHVAHLNLNTDQEPYRYLIGQVLVDKVSKLRTIVNKLGSITSEFRTFDMEVIGGVDDLDVELNECGVRYKFNFREVYWNSRLQMEHAKMVESFTSKDIICDMFCGIGPFAIPAAARGCKVYANDLNPKSYEYLVGNVKRNHVQDRVQCFNMDARDFLRKMVADGVEFHHVMMNLPADAVRFLDCFVGTFREDVWPYPLPTIHCYTFSPSKEREKNVADVTERVTEVLGLDAPPEGLKVELVRDIAPMKVMMRADFQLPASLLVKAGDAVTGPPPVKRVRTAEPAESKAEE